MLKYLKENNLVEIYIKDKEGFIVGYIEEFDDKYIKVKKISKYGFNDGYIIFKIDDILRITYESNYLKNIEKLIIENNKDNILKSKIFENFELKIEDIDIYLEFLKECYKKNYECEFNLLDDDYVIGKILKIENEAIFVLTNDNSKVILNNKFIKNIFLINQ